MVNVSRWILFKIASKIYENRQDESVLSVMNYEMLAFCVFVVLVKKTKGYIGA